VTGSYGPVTDTRAPGSAEDHRGDVDITGEDDFIFAEARDRFRAEVTQYVSE